MVSLFFALVYGIWFFRSAAGCENRNPVFWALAGAVVFYVTTNLSSLGISLLVRAATGGAPYHSDAQVWIVFFMVIAAAITLGNGVTFLVWRFFLQPEGAAWSLSSARKALAARRSLAMPGRFPFFFAMIYAMAGVLGMIAMMFLQGVFQQAVAIYYDADTLFQTQITAVFVHAIGLSLILWRFSHWRSISLLWAGLLPILSFLRYLVIVYHADFLYAPPLSGYVSQYVISFAVAACITLGVRRWGAGFPVLMGLCVASKFAGQLPTFLTQILYGLDKLALFELSMSAVWGALLGLSLYLGLLFYEGDAKTGSR